MALDYNFLQMLGQLQPEDGSINPYAMPPAAPPQPADLLAGIPGMSQPDPSQVNAMAPPPAPQPTPIPVQQAPQPAPPPPPPDLPSQQAPNPAAPPPAPAPRTRHGILDTIGQISDVLAKVGGASALYQPTLDAREDRALSLGDHARAVDMDALKKTLVQQQIASGNVDASDKQNTILGTALRGLQAIKANGGNVAAAWPLLAKQAGVPEDRAATIAQAIQADPNALEGLTSMFSDQDLGKNLYFAHDDKGNTVAYQIGSNGQPHLITLPGGATPDAPLKATDLGGSTAFVDGSGRAKTILPKTEAPGKAADRSSREAIAAAGNKTKIDVANIRGPTSKGKGGKGDDGKGDDGKGGDPTAPLVLLNNIEAGFGDLHGLGALPGDHVGLVGGVGAALGRTHLGQAIGEQAGSPSAQKRLEIVKNVSALQQAMLKNLPASATRTKFEQEMLARGLPDPAKMSYSTARTVIAQLRSSYIAALRAGAAAKPRVPGTLAPNPRRPASGGPSVSNW